jgi:energy-coupling factor transporter ATP-binding protein EcfA2
MNRSAVRSIRRITVDKLFGVHNYSLSVPEPEKEGGKLLILYGDNGSGKTTILKLAFHLLAPEGSEGHKSTAAPIPFRRFEIELMDGTKVSAERSQEQLTGSFTMRLKRPRKKEATVNFVSDQNFSVKAVSEDHNAQMQAFLRVLRELELGLYMLSDDRQIHLAGRHQERGGLFMETEFSDEFIFMDPETRVRMRQRRGLDPERIAQYLLSQSMKRTEFWIRSRAMMGSSIGESSVNALYNEILKRLVALPQDQRMDPTSTKQSIEKRVSNLERQCTKYAKYDLMPKFQGREILAAVTKAPGSQLGIIANVLNPYLESLEKKLDVFADTYRRVDSLVTVINRFLTNKTLTFGLQSGLTVTSDDNTVLTPHMFSSGERHLFLLFCNSLVAADRPSLMMIDEPEISLNIKWQRTLLSSLLECIGDSPVQYIFATHSMELLAQHRDWVVKLEDTTRG